MMASFVAFLGSAFSLGYQTCLVRLLSFHAQDEILLQSLALGCFLGALGLGTFANSVFPSDKPKLRLAWVELLLSILGVSFFYLVHALLFAIQIFGPLQGIGPTALSLSICFLLVVPLGFLTGFELPLSFQIASKRTPSIPYRNFLALSYFGAVTGSFLTILLLVPRLGTEITFTTLASGNGLLAAAIAISSRSGFRFKTLFLLGLLICFSVIWSKEKGERLVQLSLKSVYFEFGSFSWSRESWKSLLGLANSLPDVRRYESEIQMIHVLPPGGAHWLNNRNGWALYLNGHLQFSTETVTTYHETMVWGAIGLVGKMPKNVLILGGGDGLLAKELLIVPDIKIDLVEIDKEVLDLARNDAAFLLLNGSSLADPRVQVHVDDAYRFVFETQQSYDLILVDFPFPSTYELLRLFSKEFYSGLRSKLSEGGLVILDAPVWSAPLPDSLSVRPQWVLLNTLREAGFKAVSVLGPMEPFLVAREKDTPFEFDESLFPAHLAPKTHVNLLLLPEADVPSELGYYSFNSVLFPKRIRW